MDAKRQLKLSWELINYKLNGGHTCESCGIKIPFKKYVIEGMVGSVRMLFSNVNSYKKTLCPFCLDDLIQEHMAEPTTTKKNRLLGGVYIGDCQFTGQKNVPVVDVIWGTETNDRLNIRFGGSWWNGHTASADAFRILLTQTGVMKTSHISLDKEHKMIYCEGKIKHKAVSVSELLDWEL